jgi:hypothetical protein
LAGRRLALLIATDTYQDAAFSQLRTPAADVRALQAVLTDPAIGDYTVQLLSNARSHQVNQAIEAFFAGASRDDLVLLYFSGHGFKDDGNRLYLITGDSRRQLLASTAVSAQFVREQLDRCQSRRKVVILDCCYAGAFPPGTAKGAAAVDVLDGLGGRGCAVITAASALEYAFETGSSPSVSAIDEAAAPSVFTGALIEGLATGAADTGGDGLIDVDELYKYVYAQVRESVQQQTPNMRSEVEGTLYLAASPRGPRPAQLDPVIVQAVQHPLPSIRLAIVGDLARLCSGAHPGTRLAARHALDQLCEDDSRSVAQAARTACAELGGAAPGYPVTGQPAAVPPGLAAEKLMSAALSRAEAIVSSARRDSDALTQAAERDAAALRAATDHEVALLRARARDERDEILAAARREAGELRALAQQILDDSREQAAIAESDLNKQLAQWREEAEHQATEASDS